MVQTKNRLLMKFLIALFSLVCMLVASTALLFIPSMNTAYAAEKVAEFHFYEIGKGSGTRTDNGVNFNYSGIKANSYSNITIGANSTVTITVSESNLNEKKITSGEFYIYASNISYTWKRGSTTLKSGNISSFVKVGETSIAGSGDLVLSLTNSNSSDVTGVHFESPNYTLYAAEKRSVSITAGSGIKSVYMSTSSTATSGDSSGTQYADGTKVYGFAKLSKGYSSKSGWTLVSGTANAENAIYCIGSKTISSSQKSFGTISADATSYTISYTLNGGTLPSGYPSTYNITSNTFSLSNPTKTGYTFKGWSGTGLTGDTNKSVEITKGSSGNRSYTANWTVNTYNITYKDMGNVAFSGTHESGYPTQHTYGTATTLKSATKTGYTFSGWFTNSNCTGTAVTSLGATTYTANITLYAKWTANTYTVTLDQNGGSGGQGSVIAIYDSKSLDTPLTQFPTKEGYTFAGYYDEQNADGEPFPSGTLYILETGVVYTAWDKLNDATLYAYYTKDMTVSATGYEADYDGNSHTITVTVTYPESGTFILYRDPETSSTDTTNPAKTNVGSYTINFYVNKDGYTQYKGSATIVIKEVDKTALAESIATDDSYYNLIKDDYSSIASDLKDIIDNIKDNIRDNANVTAAQVAQAVVDLQTSLSTAKVDVTKAMIDAIGSGDYSAEKAAKINEAREYYDNELTEDEQAAVTNYADLQAAEALYGPVGEVVDEINALSAITDPQAFNEAVETARANYEALQDAEKAVFPDDVLDILVDSEAIIPVVDKINAIGDSEDTQDFRDKVASARADYTALSDDQKGIFPGSVLKVLTDDETAIDVMDKINLIGTVAYTAESKGKIDTANAAYGLLDDTQKALVANYGKLEQANTDYDKVNEAHSLIALLEPFEYSEDYKDALNDAREAYDALTPFQKSLVPADDLKELVDDEKAYDAMAKIDAIGKPVANDDQTRENAETAREVVDALTPDQSALVDPDFITDLENAEKVLEFLDALNAIGTPEDAEAFRDKVEDARDLYDALDEADIETLVDPADLKTLTDDEALIPVMDGIDAIGTPEDTESFREAVEDARADYDALTEDQKAIFPEDVLKVLTDDEVIVDVMDEIDTLPIPENTDIFRETVEGAREAYEALSDDQKDIFPEDVLKTLIDNEKVIDFMDAVNAIGDPENTDDFRETIENARDIYDALSDDQKALVPEDVLKILIDNEKVVEFMDAVNAIGDPENTDDFREAVEDARDIYDALSDDQKALVPEDVLKVSKDDEAVISVMDLVNACAPVEDTEEFREKVDSAREAYDALTRDQKDIFPEDTLKILTDNEAVINAMDKINVIGEVEYTPECKALIDDARETYDALTEEQKDSFPEETLNVLIDTEKAYDAMDKVNAIGILENTEESKGKVKSAREAYDALTGEQKELVTQSFVNDLENAETGFAVIDKVNAIGNVKYTETSKELIETARAAYEELTVEQKNLLSASVLESIEISEQSYETLQKNAGTILTVTFILIGILLIAGTVVLIILLKRKKDEKEGENK